MIIAQAPKKLLQLGRSEDPGRGALQVAPAAMPAYSLVVSDAIC